jgi:general secretion pathway protein D
MSFNAVSTYSSAFKLRYVLLCISTVFISSCSQTAQKFNVNTGRMQTNTPEFIEDSNERLAGNDQQRGGFTRLNSLGGSNSFSQQGPDIALQFSNTDQQQIAVNELPLRDFIQTVFGELLKVNYILADDSKAGRKVTLNFAESISSRQLYLTASKLLDENQLALSKKDDIFYIHAKTEQTRADIAIGLGRRAADVPDTVGNVLQVIPLRYGYKISLERTLRDMVSASITVDMEQNAVFVEGARQDVIRALDLIQLLDSPASRGKHIGLIETTYITPAEMADKLRELLLAEGINAATTAETQGTALQMVVIEQIGGIALFSADNAVLERAAFWANQLDKPTLGAEKRYFIYNPRYARASDLGQSVAPLIGGSVAGTVNRSRDTQSAMGSEGGGLQSRTQSSSKAETGQSALSVEGDDVRLTVDERSNSLLFYSTGEMYQSLLPIIKRLDVLPKQILLDATIAEVTMTDEFAQGFEFAFRNGRLSGGTRGSLGAGDMGGFKLDWTDGVSTMLARLSASTSLINVLSNPTLVVRDGVSANITVGNDIPTIGSTTTNPNTDTQSTTVVYRKTGVSLTVTPTINAQGLVILQIEQNISNTSDSGPSLEGSVSIFERAISTEVLAQSGQTILLGGLISENNSDNNSHVPGLHNLPLIGNLFKGVDRSKEKTELVIFITPRIIDQTEQWQEIKSKLAEGLTTIELKD